MMLWNMVMKFWRASPEIKQCRKVTAKRPSFRPCVECLEDRWLPSGTGIALSASIPTAQFGQAVTLVAKVNSLVEGLPAPSSGIVDFFDGLNTLGVGTVSNGEATCTTDSLSVGTHSAVTAAFYPDSGSASYSPSGLSKPLTETIQPDGTTVSLLASTPSAQAGQAVTLTAEIEPSVPNVALPPSGIVDFFDGQTTLGAGTVSNGVASFTTASLSAGTHAALTAAYYPDAASSTDYTSSGLSAPLTETINPQESTSATLSSSLSTAQFGQAITLTADVTPSGQNDYPPPSGVIYFFVGPTTLGAGTVHNGAATITTSVLGAGTHSALTAAYYPDAASSPYYTHSGLSVPLTVVIQPDATRVSLSSSPSNAQYGQAVTLTAEVIPSIAGVLSPSSGIVYFFDGVTTLGAGSVSNGAATFTTASLSPGSHSSLTAAYYPDAASSTDYLASSLSPGLSETIDPPGGTSVSVYSSAPTSFIGQPVTLTADVTPTFLSTFPVTSGTVYFYDGLTTLGAGPVSNGVATFTTTSLSMGLHSAITAAYYPDASADLDFNPSGLSAAKTEDIVPLDGTTVNLVESSQTGAAGQAVTFTAIVNPTMPSQATVTGTVDFYDGSNAIGSATVSNGMATFTTPLLALGTHSDITAAYYPDTASINNFGPSGMSAPLTETVGLFSNVIPSDDTTVSVFSSAPTANSGANVTFTATITPAEATAAVPTGTVSFFDGLTAIGSAVLSNGVASLSTSTLSTGTHSDITATYSPDSASSLNFNASGQSVPITETIVSAGVSVFGGGGQFGFGGGQFGFGGGQFGFGGGQFGFGGGQFGFGGGDPFGFGGDWNGQQPQTAAIAEFPDVPSPLPTNVAVFSNLKDASAGQAITFTAIVSPSNSSMVPVAGGIVYFFDGLSTLGTASVTNGVAAFTTSSLSVGTHSAITAAYYPDATDSVYFSPSGLSGAYQQLVVPPSV